MTSKEKREKVVTKYKTLLGRNIYSQDLNKRECAFKKYKDGKYYSDCSSSVRLSYKEAGIGYDNIGGNTAGIYNKYKNRVLDLDIKNGLIKNAAKILQPGDCLMFRGSDASRPLAIGHIEIVARIVGDTVYIYGHGSGNPLQKKLDTYCKQRYNMKTNTKYGNRGLACVIRIIPNDGSEKIDKNKCPYTKPTKSIKRTSSKNDIKWLQWHLNKKNKAGLEVDGGYGPLTKSAVLKYWKSLNWNKDGKDDGWTAGKKTIAKLSE